MPKDEPRDINSIMKRWSERAKKYDEWYETFNGAVEHHLDWELLKKHLPKNRDSKILDAAGGTGRITFPLAKMGYSVTLCDISPQMLNVARQKLLNGEVLDKVKILECDVRKLNFADESFDFVLCWGGTIEGVKELVRVTRKGGKISIFLVNKYGVAISKFREDPDAALSMLRSKSKYVYDKKEKQMVVSVEEIRELFEKVGVNTIEIYAVCGMLELIGIPEKIRESCTWDKKLFKQVTEMLLMLSKEPSAKGLSRHLVLYGERI